MIKEAMQYLLGLDEPHYLDYGRCKYTDKGMHTLRAEVKIDALQTRTLQGIVDYVKEGADAPGLYGLDRLIIHVAGADQVYLYDELNNDGFRQCRIEASAELSQLRLNSFCSLEQMLIMLQSNFVETAERARVLGVLGNMEAC